jgi:putative membrane protein
MTAALVLVELAAVGALYAGAARRIARWPAWRSAAFALGLAVLAVALVALDAAADRDLVAHMGQHLTLALAAAPLLVLGSPVALGLRATGGRARRLFGVTWLAHPAFGWLALVAAMVVAHLPAVLDAAERHPWVHALEHLGLLGAAVLFWRPVLGADPVPHRPGVAGRLVYLLAAAGPMAVLGIALTLSERPWYATYGGAHAVADQHAAGALMWIGGGAASALLTVAAVWSAVLREHRRRLAYERALA